MPNKPSRLYQAMGAQSGRPREENDYYATDPKALQLLMEYERFHTLVYEPACGGGHLAKVLEAHQHVVRASDLYDHGYGEIGVDFLSDDRFNPGCIDADIVTNPPFGLSDQFAIRAVEAVKRDCVVALFLKLSFLEGQKRRSFFQVHPPERVYISSSRISCGPNGDFSKKLVAMQFAWFIWRKGFIGEPAIRWFN